MKYISPLQYITQKRKPDEIFAEVESFLTGGGDWVQLRMKNTPNWQYLAVAKRIKELCYSFNATLIINDNLDVALDAKADGIHLGKGDMPTSMVRPLVGKKFIIGRTANTIRDIEILNNQAIDYMGVGPYRYTRTKDNLSPILGVEGYETLFAELEKRGVDVKPIVAIGGIKREDIALLGPIKGLKGIAVSGAIANADSPLSETRSFINDVEKYFDIANYNIK